MSSRSETACAGEFPVQKSASDCYNAARLDSSAILFGKGLLLPIYGVQTKPLKVIPDERGRLMEILRCDDALFRKFGQVYMTTVYPGVVKAWHYHKVQHDSFAVVRGMLKLVLFDSREGSPTRGQAQEFFIGVHNPLLVQIPPMV